MAKVSKRFAKARESVDRIRQYTLDDTIALVREAASAKFDETVEVAVNLGVNPKHSDQVVRGTCILPHGTGRTVNVLVFARGDKADEAREAGADAIGDEETVDRIKGGWLDFDVVIATPDMMKALGPIARILGPRGLMPNPKTGTVTLEVGQAVREAKAGKITFRVDKTGVLHVPVGKVSFDELALRENIVAFMEKVMQLKPSTAKGKYIISMSVSSTMGPGVRVDTSDLRGVLK
jgi:large subunit ribosomal protein L1